MRNITPPTINTVLIIGLGRIGLPFALSLAHAGILVRGFDYNANAVESLKKGHLPFQEPMMEEYFNASIHKKFFPCASLDELSEHFPKIDAIIFAIGTNAPQFEDVLNSTAVDLSPYFNLLDALFSYQTLKKGIHLIIRTTMPLGGTDQLKHYLEEKYNLHEGNDFYFSFVPERITEGSAIAELKTIPKIIGVYSDAAFLAISTLLQKINPNIIRVKNPITAEFCKLTDNSFRNMIFGYANEIAMHAQELHINVEEVINTVNNDYKRNYIPKPGFVSGYCLSKDPYIFELDFLKNKEKRDFQSIWYYSRRTNDYLIDFVAYKVLNYLNYKKNSRITLLGLSFKEDMDDFRMSHTFKIMEKLLSKISCTFNVYDPHLNKNQYTILPQAMLPTIVQQSNQLDQNNLFLDSEAIIICNPHKALCEAHNPQTLQMLLADTKKPCYLFDGWNIWQKASQISHIIYEGLGMKTNQVI